MKRADKRGKVWGGRMAARTAPLMEAFSRSVDLDRRLWREEVAVNRAWMAALRRAGVLSVEDERRLRKALAKVERELRDDAFTFLPADEDLHTAVERRLTELAGEAGKKIHTGRSRNDQVVTEFRLWLMRRGTHLRRALLELAAVVVAKAGDHVDLVVPAYTHNQQAQPIRLAHYLLSLFHAVARHDEQIVQWLERVDECPLGCGAVAGTTLPLDRLALARELGFSRAAANSVDATGHRGFAVEAAFVCADLGATLSRYAADFVSWCAAENGLMDPGERYATGSSMMPNKKNPDAFELVRGKAARLLGDLVAVLALQKGLPVSYARDLQEDKPPVMDALDTAEAVTRVIAGALEDASFRAVELDDGLLATDLADRLVGSGRPFREAHETVAAAVRRADARGVRLLELPAGEWDRLGVPAETLAGLSAEAGVEARSATGGTARARVREQLRRARRWLARRGPEPAAAAGRRRPGG